MSGLVLYIYLCLFICENLSHFVVCCRTGFHRRTSVLVTDFLGVPFFFCILSLGKFDTSVRSSPLCNPSAQKCSKCSTFKAIKYILPATPPENICFAIHLGFKCWIILQRRGENSSTIHNDCVLIIITIIKSALKHKKTFSVFAFNSYSRHLISLICLYCCIICQDLAGGV